MAEKLVREVYEVRGFDFAHCCGINSMYNLELGESIMQRLFGLVDFELTVYRTKRKPGFKKWNGKIKGLEGAYLNVSEVSGYLTRVSLVYKESDAEIVKDIKAVLGGIKTRTLGKKTLLDCFAESSKNEENHVNVKKLPSCGRYSSD